MRGMQECLDVGKPVGGHMDVRLWCYGADQEGGLGDGEDRGDTSTTSEPVRSVCIGGRRLQSGIC